MPAQDTEKTYQAICHPIRDEHDWPIANLMVFLNHQGFANRAEIYLNVDVLERNGTEQHQIDDIEEFALSYARELVNENYPAFKDDLTKLEVRLLHVNQYRQTEHFDLAFNPSQATKSLLDPWLLAAIGAIAMILIGVIWGFSTLLNRSSFQAGGETGLTDGAISVSDAIVDDNGFSQSTVSGSANAASDAAVGIAQNAIAQNSVESSGATENVTSLPTADPTLPQTNGLPPSTNANTNLRVGQRIRVVPGAALTLRTQPGAAAGEEIGFMQNAQEATIVGGPVWLQGQSDTIVWWFVELDEGIRAWAPANDSRFTVLEPAPRG